MIMDNKFICARTCVYRLNYHIVWYVKCHREVLSVEIADRLCCLLKSIGEEKGFTVIECNVEEGNLVHCFVSSPPKLSVTSIVKYLKGISGNVLLREFPLLTEGLGGCKLWNNSYFCESIGSESKENVVLYLKKQSCYQ